MFDLILCLSAVLVFAMFILLMLGAAFEDTDTFKAIDEKISRLIRGKDDDN